MKPPSPILTSDLRSLTSCFAFKAMHCFYSNVDAPKPRNLTKEMLQTLSGYQQTAPGYLAVEQRFQPQYADLARMIAARNMTGNAAAPGTLQLGAGANTFMRGADINDVARYGPAATTAFLRSNPLLAGSLGNLYGRTQDSTLLQKLNAQAGSALDSGGRLSAQDVRGLGQQSRALFANRGMLHGNQSIGAELLSRDAAVRQRQAAAQQLASGVQGLNQGQNDFVGRASQIFSSTLSDPFQAILGRSSGAGGGGPAGQAQQIGTGARLFDPNNPYAADVYNTNYNAQASANIANTQASNAQTSAIIGLVGQLLLSDKKLKRKIKKIGVTKSGIPIKSFEYKRGIERAEERGSGGLKDSKSLNRSIAQSPARFVGVVAQDVEKRRPDAVFTLPSGHKAVNMGAIDAPFYQVRSKKDELRSRPSLGELLAA